MSNMFTSTGKVAIQHKRGDTFARLVTYRFSGQPVDLRNATITAQVRDKDGNLVSNLEIQNSDLQNGQFVIYSFDTSSWPLSDANNPLYSDVKVVDGSVNRTNTFAIYTNEEITQ